MLRWTFVIMSPSPKIGGTCPPGPYGSTSMSVFRLRHCSYLIKVDDGNALEAVHVSIETIIDRRRLVKTILSVTRRRAANETSDELGPS